MIKRWVKGILTILAMSIIILPSNINSHAFGLDIVDHWAKEHIIYLADKGFIKGYPDGSFKPEESITRAEFLTMVNNTFGYREEAHISFKDVEEGSWYYKEIRKAAKAGYIRGYGDGTMKPENPISRQEVASIVAALCGLEKEVSNSAYDFNDWQEIGGWAINYVGILKDKGYVLGYEDNTFRPKSHIKRGEAAKLIAEIDRKMDKPEEEMTKVEEFISLVEELPHANAIIQIIAQDKVKLDRARQIYNQLKDEEKDGIPSKIVSKFLEVESKIESLKTPLISPTKTTVEQAQAWARSKGAHQRFIDIAPVYWEYGELTGINPEILYAQAAKETNYGRYTGAVLPEMNNWAGIKVREPMGDRTEDHESFETPEDGVRAHFNHMGVYCGVEPIGEPHPRWYVVMTASWRGTVKYVEDLGGRWAPSPDYGISIVRDYLKYLYD